MGWLASLREDIQVAKERDPAARSSLEILLTYPGIHALAIHRIAHGLAVRGWIVLPRLIAHLGRALTGIEIHPRAEIGPRLFIDHGMGIVIGETTVIGEDCHLYQGVTLGGTSTRREKRHPTLEDHVVVGAGAKIIGAITLGSHSRIGAGSVVVSNVPPNATVVGVPGHIVAFTNATNDTVERLPDPEWDRLQELERRVARLEQSVQGKTGAPAPTGGGFDGGPPPSAQGQGDEERA
jgi:serine O-acetyltransferase